MSYPVNLPIVASQFRVALEVALKETHIVIKVYKLIVRLV